MCLSEWIREVALCEKLLHERTKEIKETDPDSLQYDILLMEMEILQMYIARLQASIDKKQMPQLSVQTRKMVYSIKSTSN